jgi:hypothetical protein
MRICDYDLEYAGENGDHKSSYPVDSATVDGRMCTYIAKKKEVHKLNYINEQ